MFNIRDYVKLKDTDSIGIIKKIIQKNTDEIYIIEINKKKVSTSKYNLILSSKEELENTNSRYIKNKTSNENFSLLSNYTKDFSNEIMLRHQTLDEAMFNLENFLDLAYINDIKVVRIVHGKHGGVLRHGVHELLKKDKRIKSFRLGNYFEGSYGVTIAYFK